MRNARKAFLGWLKLRKVFFLAFFLVVNFMSGPASAYEDTVFGPEELRIGWFRIHVSLETFAVADAGQGTIVIHKITPEKKIGDGIVRLNNEWISLSSFLPGDDATFEQEINLRSHNYLFVVLRGAHGSSIRLEIRNAGSVPENNPPEADHQSVTTSEDTAVAITLSGADPDGDSLAYQLISQPNQGALTGAPPNLTYTPHSNVHGEDSFNFRVNDGELDSAEATVSIIIIPVNDAPVADALAVTTDEDTPVAITLTGSDIDDDSLSYQITAEPSNGLLSGTPPGLTYCPDKDFNGSDAFTFLVNDGPVDSVPATVNLTIAPTNDKPTADAGVDQALYVDALVALDGSGSSDVDGDSLTYKWSFVSLPPGSAATISADPLRVNPTFVPDVVGSYVVQLVVNDGADDSDPDMVEITAEAKPHTVKPQPEGSFGNKYDDLIPPDVTVDAYDPRRFSLITGLVRDAAGLPLADVFVTILGRPEYGSVKTDSQGRFSIPMEGGMTITVEYQKVGLITVQRKVSVSWNDIAVAETVQMIAEDNISTIITFDGDPGTVTVHRSTEVVGEVNGELKSRALTMVFHGDNRAYEVDVQGTVLRELTEITTRATEFPTPESMPAALPPTSAFTYCAELSVDGAERITFDQPVVVWLDNFLGFSVGEIVPVGSYDRAKGVWLPEDNGVVVRLLDTDADGLADGLDASGDGQKDDLDGDGSYNDEVHGLNSSENYPPGSTFWRAEIQHFSPFDLNWPPVLPRGAEVPNATRKATAYQQKEEGKDCKNRTSSFVEERSGIFHEEISVPGTDVSLRYVSNAVEGYSTVITVPASGETVPDILRRIIVKVEVAGRVFEQTFEGPADALNYKTAEFAWDGLDHLGRVVEGVAPARVKVGFVYPMFYASSIGYTSGFGQPGQGSTTIPARVDGVLWKNSSLDIRVRSRDERTIARGWSISNRHWLSPVEPSVLYKGDGTVLKNAARIIKTYAGNGNSGLGGDGGPATDAELAGANSLTVDVAGNLYITGYFSNTIRKVDTKNIITTVAGTGQAGYNGDGIPATQAMINGPRGTTVDREGNLYFADPFNYRVRKVDTKGIITTIAGTGQRGFSGDGGPATQARLNWPAGVALDDEGNLYIVDDHRIRKIDPNGVITTVAGNGECTYRVTEGPALQASLCYPDDVEVDSAGNVYIADNGNGVIRKVDTSGTITTFAGNPNCSIYNGGHGVPATEACLNSVLGMYVDSEGNLYLADSWNYCLRKVDINGIIITVVGNCGEDGWGYSGDGGPAAEARMGWTWDVEGDPSGNLYIGDDDNAVVRKVVPSSSFLETFTSDEISFVDSNGLGYVISRAGNHKRTIDLDTGVVLYEFDYDEDGNLVSFNDRFGNRTLIERNGAGLPTAIVSPDGIRTGLSIDPNGYLIRISYPDGSFYSFEYTADGLMTAKIEPEGNRFGHGFDASGRLISATDEEGGDWQYSRINLENGDTLTQMVTAEGEETSYLDRRDLTGAYSSTITGPTTEQTVYTESSDDRSVTKDLPCGTKLHFTYDFDPEYAFRFVSEMIESSQSGVERVTLRGRIYADNDGDSLPEVITERVTVNGKTTALENNVPQARKTFTSPVGKTVIMDYDPQTLLTSRVSVEGLKDTMYGYDSRGRIREITTGNRGSSFTYDAKGNLASITDPENHTTTYAYDAVGRMTGISRPDGSSVAFTYDRNGNMIVLTNPATIDHIFRYNKVNLNSSYAPPLSGRYTYIYDKDRRLSQVNYPSGKQITNIYANGALEEIRTPEGNIDLVYLCGSKVDTISKGIEAITYGYDGPLLTLESLSGTLNESLSYSYNNDFNLMSFTYGGGTVSYTYDNDGLLTGAGYFTISRNGGNGLPVSVAGGALNLSRVFNGYGEVEGHNFTVGGQGLTSWNLIRDNAGKIIGKTETVDGVTSNYVYTYDPMGRLLTVTRDGTLVEEYEYDSVGTRIYESNSQRSITERTFSYDDEDHLLTAGDATYQYDLDGYLTSKTVGTELPYEVTGYSYSSRGELLRVTMPDGSLIEYLHDPLGRRIAKKVNGIITEKYLWQGLTRLLAVYDGSDNLVMRFLYADSRTPVAIEKNAARYYLTFDQVGSLRVVADGSGNVVKRIDYDSFGNIVNDTNASFEIPFGFAGGLHDRDTHLVRFGFRDYDPDTGRWTAKDPIGFAGGQIDLYGYCLNDPINWIDPEGRFGIFGAVVGGLSGAIGGFTYGLISSDGSLVAAIAGGAAGGIVGAGVGSLNLFGSSAAGQAIGAIVGGIVGGGVGGGTSHAVDNCGEFSWRAVGRGAFAGGVASTIAAPGVALTYIGAGGSATATALMGASGSIMGDIVVATGTAVYSNLR